VQVCSVLRYVDMVERRGIAIFGYDRAAVELASYLRGGSYRILIIDDDPENLKRAAAQGFETAVTDFRDDTELAKLGLGRAIDTLFCLFPDDAENVFLALSARTLAPKLLIISIAHGRGAVPNLQAAGVDKVIETREISGLRIWDIITRPVVTGILDKTLFGQANLNIAEIPILESAFLIGRRVADAGLERDYDLILLGVVDSDGNEFFVFSPNASDTRLNKGDILLVIGPTAAIEKLRGDLEESGQASGSPLPN
jgi:voltage-gated potassium channel